MTTAASAVAGDDLLVQNLGGHSIRVEVSATIPLTFNVGLLVSPKNSAQAVTAVGEKVWAFCPGEVSLAHLEVL